MEPPPSNHPLRRWLELGLLTAECLIAFILMVPRNPPKLYQGKTISEWIFQLDANVTQQKQHDEAVGVLQRIGAPVVPEVEHVLRRRPGSWPEQARMLAVRAHLLQWEQPNLADKQFRAARAAYEVAELANVDIRRLVPLLTYHLTNSNYAEVECARALADAGPEGISVLTNLMTVGEVRLRDQATVAMQHVRNQPGVNEALLRAAADTNLSVRVTAMITFPHRGGPTNEFIAVGLRALKSQDGYERWAGAVVLGKYLSVPEVKTTLQSVVDDPDQRVRSSARRALGIKEAKAE